MHYSNETLSQKLVAIAKNDLSVRETLVAEGTLRLSLLPAYGSGTYRQCCSPGQSLVGEEGAWAAWLIAQHAIGNPSFMRHCLSLLKQAANHEVMPWQIAFLEDRIRMYEGQPQVYGTQFQSNKTGQHEPYPIVNSESVNDRRFVVGLNTIGERTAELTAQCMCKNIPSPPDLDEQYQQWLYSVGWRIAN